MQSDHKSTPDLSNIVLVVANLARTTQPVELDLSAFAGLYPVELFGRAIFPRISSAPYLVTLGPHAFHWFELLREPEDATARLAPVAAAEVEVVPSVEVGAWEGFVPGVGPGALYKYAIRSRVGGYRVDKSDLFAFAAEIRPQTAPEVWDLSGCDWGDQDWMARRRSANALGAPISVYEVHLGSWQRKAEEDNRWLTYREMAPLLADYAHDMGYTHVEVTGRGIGGWRHRAVIRYTTLPPATRTGPPSLPDRLR